MLSEINQKLFELKDKIRIRDKNKGELGHLLKQLDAEERKLAYLKKELEKEYRDVNELEGLSFAGIFHSIIGNKEELLEKEKQEYLAVKLKFDSCIGTMNILRKEITGIKEELKQYVDLEKRHDALIAEKEKLITDSNDPVLTKLNEYSEKISGYKLNLNEIDESVSAGESLKQILLKIIDTLESARGWGTWDIVGGGIISTAIKHEKIDQARADISIAQMRLTRFSNELKDTGLGGSISINLSGFETFADYFFDNFIIDLAVQNKINNSLQQSRSVFERVQSILSDLVIRRGKLETDILEADKLRKAAIENS